MAEGSSRHLKKCDPSASRGLFKSKFCQRCESQTTQLCYEIKTEQNFCFKCQHFTETVDYRIKPEISFCQDCRVLMKITSYETDYNCPIYHQLKKKKNYTPKKDCSQAPITKEYYLQKRYSELICGLTLDHIPNSTKVALAIGHWQLGIGRLGIQNTMQFFAGVTAKQ